MTDNQKNILPKHWDTKKLEDLISYAIGGDWGKDENYQDADYDFAYCIRGSELKNWKEEKGKSASLRKIKKSNIIKRKLQVGDILVEISGGGPEQPVGRTVVIDQSVLDFESHITKICTNFFRLIRPVEDVDSSFLNFYLTFFYFSGEIGKFQSGSNNLRNLKFPDYLKLQIPLPSFPEQQKIVQKIESLFTELEIGIETLKTVLTQLKIYRQAVLNHFLTNDKWEMVRLGDICDRIFDGPFGSNLKSSDYTSSGVQVVRLENIGFMEFFEEKETFVSEDKYQSLIKHEVFEGDIIFSSFIGDYIRTTILPNLKYKAIAKADCFCIRPKEKLINKQFLTFVLSSIRTQKILVLAVHGATRPRINTTQLKTFSFPLPSLKIQTQIVSEIEKRMAGADVLEASLKAQLINAENLRQSILKRAFEGKLV